MFPVAYSVQGCLCVLCTISGRGPGPPLFFFDLVNTKCAQASRHHPDTGQVGYQAPDTRLIIAPILRLVYQRETKETTLSLSLSALSPLMTSPLTKSFDEKFVMMF